MKHALSLGLFLAFLISFVPELSFAQSVGTGDTFAIFPQAFQDIADTWESVLKKYATYLFFTLGVINFALHFGFLATEGLEFGKLMTELVRFIMTFGFFFWLLDNGPYIASVIINSCVEMGIKASETPDGSKLIDLSYEAFAVAVVKVGLFNIVLGALCSIISLGILIVLTLAAVNLLIEYCAIWVLVYAGFFILGLGSTSWTRDIAINYLKTVLQAGLRVMSMILILGVGKSVMEQAFYNIATGDDWPIHAYTVVLMAAVMMLIMMVKVPKMMAGLITGGSFNNPTLGLGWALTTAAMTLKSTVDTRNLFGLGGGNTIAAATSTAPITQAPRQTPSPTGGAAGGSSSSRAGVFGIVAPGFGFPTGVRSSSRSGLESTTRSGYASLTSQTNAPAVVASAAVARASFGLSARPVPTHPRDIRYYSTYEERVGTTPSDQNTDRGYWEGARGESMYVPSDPAVIAYLDAHGVKGITYNNGVPDFSDFSRSTVRIDNMTNNRDNNFEQADKRAAAQWNAEGFEGKANWTARDVSNWRRQSGAWKKREGVKHSWHEHNDMQTMLLVPTNEVNGYFGHFGGVGEYNRMNSTGGGFDE